MIVHLRNINLTAKPITIINTPVSYIIQFFSQHFTPKLNALIFHLQDFQTNRTLTLISKTIQSLGNLVSSRSAQQPCKEEYTGQLYKKFCTEKHVEAVKHFLEVISTVGANPNENTLLEPVLLKEG